MLLQALYEYGKAHPDSYLPEGCKLKNPKAIIHLTSDAEFVGVSKRDKGAGSVVCPSIFNEANNTVNVTPMWSTKLRFSDWQDLLRTPRSSRLSVNSS